ncbi:LacI family DNA-binding transcriptional regulator [Carboxylicivirga sp. M1479]|uniref:LacI family DNA-binding transcriptional regulator n=1 Tax=Carboxylicivirga sp. M1479 TaxID=2594476 RepID=UPI001177FAA6|nr:LacI family DNA-binding transcriptional regulator [Carboxylicivirga sp. M1479]TRX71584.1 LacI family transcriptional regulator [Carboxylicivirga sp. M1479]
MKSQPITIKDIARILGISPSTVSRALKDHPDISPKTKQLVQTFAEKVNYRPNALALSLRSSKTNTIGIVIPEIVHHFFSSVISGIEDVAYGRGYNAIICQTNENYQREVIDLQALVDNRVDGILVSMSKNTHEFTHFNNLKDNGVPVVFFDRICDQINSDRVIADDFEGARIATRHLISKGCKKIMHLAAPQHLLIGKNRKEGYCSALKENKLNCEERLIVKCDTREAVFAKADDIIRLAPEVDGIFAVNDSTAIAAMQVLQRNGYNIPKDIAVAGFGDGPNANIAYPPLTTVEQKGYDIGQAAMRLLIGHIENTVENEEFETKIFTPELVERMSSNLGDDPR